MGLYAMRLQGKNRVAKERNNTVDRAVELINQLDEPQKPVVPQFVADYIEYYKKTGITLGTWFNFVHEYEFERKTEKWIYSGSYEENLKREYLLIDAIRNGYEVEKEKRHFIKEPVTGQFLIRDDSQSRGVKWVDGFSTSPSYFTEAEIKAIDERYWAFAEEVTE